MPGPVSDSYDPEFGTGANAGDVHDAMKSVVAKATSLLGPELKNIVVVAQGPTGQRLGSPLTEKEWRVIRFGLLRAMESV